jgi:hypothetical protein
MPREVEMTDIVVQGSRFVMTMGLWLVIMGLPAVAKVNETRLPIPILATASASQAMSESAPSSQSPASQAMPTKGMSKEAVRELWGDPAEVRKIRTCFGWQEEWMYRGDQQRYGADQRTLLFDEGEVLSKIK